ncbi:NUDIX domain-containing protein [Rhizobiaceae bacterium BDR2-2]|uniref:NUDIX domain-containing protein n=1 Tax=Ectorhizobium quercum TaxID=2965071 RepID=A0AAE3MY51_9HYPH|nr:NUDIX domain-containing protein [Ectorhizobium quercum]MCX8996606.1 NUDIX domain-containing protein [Ectorhizobium quercum]
MSDTGSGNDGLQLRHRLLLRLVHPVQFFLRGMTLGVRAACFNERGEVFLVRHTYVPGWYLPGGGVERGETAMQALLKELREEGNLEPVSTPVLFHAYFNHRVSRRDHVLLYRAEVRQTAPRPADREIAESGFFDPERLPENATKATRLRLDEIRGLQPPPDHW